MSKFSCLLFFSLIGICLSQQLDENFGIISIDFSGGRDSAYSVVEKSGRYYVTGPAFVNNTNYGLVSIDDDGDLVFKKDYDLGGNGSRTDVPTRIVEHAGGLVIGGTTQVATVGNNLRFSLLKVDKNGNKYQSFGNQGIVLTDIDIGANDEIFDLDVDKKDRIVATGFGNPGQIVGAGPAFNFATARYLKNGELDATFADQGKLITSFGPTTDDRGRAVLVTKNNGIILAGRTRQDPSPNFNASLASYNEEGELDTKFGRQRSDTNYPNLNDQAGFVVQSAGTTSEFIRLLSLGNKGFLGIGNSDGSFLAGKYDKKGRLDKHFQFVKYKYNSTTTDILHSGAIDFKEEKIYLVGNSRSGTTDRPFVIRLDMDGSLDRSFGQDGKYIFPLPNGQRGFFRDVLIVKCDRLLLVGESYVTAPSSADFLITRIKV